MGMTVPPLTPTKIYLLLFANISRPQGGSSLTTNSFNTMNMQDCDVNALVKFWMCTGLCWPSPKQEELIQSHDCSPIVNKNMFKPRQIFNSVCDVIAGVITMQLYIPT